MAIRVRAHRQSARLKSAPKATIARAGNRLQGGLPIPPGPLIYLVAGIYDVDGFCDGGASANLRIREILSKNGLDVRQFKTILEFGCGVGRIIRHWSLGENTTLFGTDYNPRLISWCSRNLPVANFQVNRLEGALEFENEQFDFIYAWSVFTHLSEPLQFHWLEELARVLHRAAIST